MWTFGLKKADKRHKLVLLQRSIHATGFYKYSSEWHSKKISSKQESNVIFFLPLYSSVLISFVKAEDWNSTETMEHLGRLHFNHSGFLAEFGSINRGELKKKSTGNFPPKTKYKIEAVVVHVYYMHACI